MNKAHYVIVALMIVLIMEMIAVLTSNDTTIIRNPLPTSSTYIQHWGLFP